MAKTRKETHLVFGYGTLQHGPDMTTFDSQLASFGATYVGDGILFGCMIARASCMGTVFAGLVRTPTVPGAYALGEVWQVDTFTLEMLDRREQYKPLTPERSVYTRELFAIRLRKTRAMVQAWAYTVDAYRGTSREVLTHSWPTEHDSLRWATSVRKHAPLTLEEMGDV